MSEYLHFLKHVNNEPCSSNFKCGNYLVNEIHDRKISFAYEEIKEFPVKIVKLLWKDITHLDLSGNQISNFEFLVGFIHLRSLICDGNVNIGKKDTLATFPKIVNLDLLYCNNCEISSTADFLLQISSLFPKIKYLSHIEWKTLKVDDENRLHCLRMLAIFMNPFLRHYNDKMVRRDEKIHANECHQNSREIDCTAPMMTSYINRNDVHKIMRYKREMQKRGDISHEIEEFIENQKIESSLSSFKANNYLKNFSTTSKRSCNL